MDRFNYLFDKSEFLELKKLYLEDCKSIGEISEWLGIPSRVVSKYIAAIYISKSEFQEKEATFEEILQLEKRKSITKIIHKKKQRLEKVYDNSRNHK